MSQFSTTSPKICYTGPRIKDILTDPKKWTQGVLARSPTGERVESDAEEAVCWCAEGVTRCLRHHYEYPDFAVRDTAIDLLGGRTLHVWNDDEGRTFEEVVDLLTNAEKVVFGETE